MNKLKLYFVIISVTLVLFSCNKADDVTPVPIRDYAVQNAIDNTTIEDYLKSYRIEQDGLTVGQEIKLSKIDDPSQHSLMSLYDATGTSPVFPKLLSVNVSLNDIIYKIYYLKMRDDNPLGVAPSRIDEVLTAYAGSYLQDNTTTTAGVPTYDVVATSFDSVLYPTVPIGLDRTIKGWPEIFPLFKTGNYDPTQTTGPAVYNNYGAGVMFIPSGLAYFYQAVGTIPSYSPLVFTFKLYDMRKADQDGDGIYSDDEDLNHNGIFTDDDTDGDGKQNYLDIDDDGDGYLTKDEIHKNADGTIIFEDTDGDGIPNYLDSNNH